MLFEEVSKFERGEPHRDAKRFGFVRPCYDTAIVIGQHDHWLAMPHRLKQSFTRHVEVITVDQGKECCHCYGLPWLSHTMNDVSHHTPDLEGGRLRDRKWRIVVVLWDEHELPLALREAFDGEFAIDDGNDNAAITGCQSTVYN